MRNKAPLISFIISSLIKASVITLFTFGFSATAQWYESQGYARVDKSNIDIARTKAMENALKKALLVAGASVSSVQQVVNGLITQDEISIRASGSVNSIELIDEVHSENLITVTIRADIFPQEKQCFAVDFRKSLLITRSHLVQREQANIGKIYNIDTAIMQTLNKQLSQYSAYTKPKALLKSKTAFSRLNNNMAEEKIKQLAMSLSQHTNNQYILFSEINDISFGDSATNSWQFWQQSTYERNFNLSLYLYSGINGELIWQNTYSDSAEWDFTKRQTVDVNSNTFWQSDYGTMINKILDGIVTDIDESVMCEPSRGKIVQVAGNTVTINLGRHHGVKIGDSFSLLHLNNFTSDDNHTYAGFNVSPYKVKVTHVTKESATATTSDDNLLGNIQINDLAVRY